MNNLLQSWKESKIPLHVVILELKKLLADKRWSEYYLSSENDDVLSYTNSLKFMKEMAHLSRCGYASSIFSEDLALQLIKDALEENLEYIGRWLMGNDTSMQLFIFADDPIGTIVYSSDLSIDDEVQYAILCLRKCDIPCKNTSGFFVEYIFPALINNI